MKRLYTAFTVHLFCECFNMHQVVFPDHSIFGHFPRYNSAGKEWENFWFGEYWNQQIPVEDLGQLLPWKPMEGMEGLDTFNMNL